MTKYQVVRLAWFQQLEILHKEEERAKLPMFQDNPITKEKLNKERKKEAELYALMEKYEQEEYSDEIME